MALGVNPVDTGLMQQGMRIQSQLLQNLGAQLRSDVQTLQTNRQLSGLAQNIQSIDPNSPDFAPKLVGLMSQYPMAAQSPIGQAAINTLGAQHRAYQAELAAQRSFDRSFDRQIGLLAVDDWRKKRTYGSGPATAEDIRRVANGEPPLPDSGGPSIPPSGAPEAAGFDVNQAVPNAPSDVAPILAATGNPAAATMAGMSQGVPAQAQRPSISPIESLRPKIEAFRQGLIKDGVPEELGDQMLKDYAKNLMSTTTGRAATPFKQQLRDGTGLIVTDPSTGQANVIKYPQGAVGYVPGSGGSSDPAAKAIIQTKARAMSDYIKAKAIADRELEAYNKKNVNENDPADVALKWDMGIKANAARAAAESLKNSIGEIEAGMGAPAKAGEDPALLTGGIVRGQGKQLPPDIRQQAEQAMRTKGKNAVINRLLEQGYDVTGL